MPSYLSFPFKKSEGFGPTVSKLSVNWVVIWKVQSMENTMTDFGIFSVAQLTQKQLNKIGNVDWGKRGKKDWTTEWQLFLL